MIRLQELRTEKGLSQEEAAKALGVTQQSYSRYERGGNELGYSALIKFAKFFDVSVDYLLGNSTYFYPDLVQSPEERELLELFGEMSAGQKARFLAYGEGLLGKEHAIRRNP